MGPLKAAPRPGFSPFWLGFGGGVSREEPRFPLGWDLLREDPRGCWLEGTGGALQLLCLSFPLWASAASKQPPYGGRVRGRMGWGGGGSGAPLGMGGRGGLFLLGSTVRVVGRGLRVRGPVGTLNDQAGLIPGPGGPPQSLRSRATATGGIRDRAVRDPRGRAP